MSDTRPTPAVVTKGLRKSYRLGKVTLDVLKGVDFRVKPGEFVAVTGASGSGKSTLLHLIGLLDRPDAGEITLDGESLSALPSRRRNAIRCSEVGFVFQFYHLQPELTVLENVLMPAMVDSTPLGWWKNASSARGRAEHLLEEMGLAERRRHRPKELSGGERQRVALARALMNAPKLLLADEPTGNLDSRTGRKIIDLLHVYNRRHNQTVVMVTHDDDLAAEAGRFVTLQDGILMK